MAKHDEFGLYFLALVPPEPIASIVQDIKRDISNRYSSHASLKSPPHITLHMPFRYPLKKEQMIYGALEAVKIHKSVLINQNGFGCFLPKVIFIKVEENAVLRDLQKKVTLCMRINLNVLNTNYKDQAFHPHMTIAFRDLKKTEFFKAWSEYENRVLLQAWETVSFFLMKHNGTSWEQHKEFQFVANH